MRGLMMDYPLDLGFILRRAETFHAEREVVSRSSAGAWHRYNYAEMARRAQRLALALAQLGLARSADLYCTRTILDWPRMISVTSCKRPTTRC